MKALFVITAPAGEVVPQRSTTESTGTAAATVTETAVVGPSPEDSEALSLSQLKYNFQQRMNEAIRQQRERMRILLNDVDSVSCQYPLPEIAHPRFSV